MGMVLDGIRVLDWSVFQAGPIAGMLLGDMGADVIKIEEPVGGDLGRGVLRVVGAITSQGQQSRNFYFEIGNRNKKSIGVDLKRPEGRQIIYQLVEKSDVFLHNFRHRAALSVGMDYETLSKFNPRIVYAHASGWGPKGPDSGDPSADYTGVARAGLFLVTPRPGVDPEYPQGGIGDQCMGIMTALGILAALFERERTGVGQKVDTSILGSVAFLLGYPVGFQTLAGINSMYVRRDSAGNPLWNHYRCSDGKWIALAHLAPDRFWPIVCRAMGLDSLVADERFNTMDNRTKNCQELIRLLDSAFATKTRDEWTKIFKKNEVIFAPVNTIPELTQDPQAIANDYITEFDHPSWGRTRTIGFPIGLSRTPLSIRNVAPELGQHTEEILLDVLGYKWDEIARLKEARAII